MGNELGITGESFGSAFGGDRTIREDGKYCHLKKFLDKYDGNTDSLDIVIAKDILINAAWNKAHLAPIDNSYPIFVHPVQHDIGDRFIRIIYGKELIIATVEKSYF